MVSDSIIIALITGGITLCCNIISNLSIHKKEHLVQAVRDQEIKDKLDILEKKVDEHNGYAKRFVEIEKSLVKLSTKMELKHE